MGTCKKNGFVKNFILACLVFIMFSSSIMNIFSTNQPMKVSISDVKGIAGDYVYVDVNFENICGGGVCSGHLNVYYDSKYLSIEPKLDAGIFSGTNIPLNGKYSFNPIIKKNNQTNEDEIVGFTMVFDFNGKGMVGSSCKLASLKFKINEKCPLDSLNIGIEGESPFYYLDDSNGFEYKPISDVEFEDGQISLDKKNISTSTPALIVPTMIPTATTQPTVTPVPSTAQLSPTPIVVPTTGSPTPTSTTLATTPTATQGSVTTPASSKNLEISLENVYGLSGTTVEMPVYLKNVPAGGISSGKLLVVFDNAKFEFTEVKAENLVYDKSNDLSSNVSSNTISILYLDNTMSENTRINSDGKLCTLKFKILQTCPLSGLNNGYKVEVKSGGDFYSSVFNDGMMDETPIKDVVFISGSISVVNQTPTDDPSGTPRPTAVSTSTPTSTITQTPTITPTITPTATPTSTATPTPTAASVYTRLKGITVDNAVLSPEFSPDKTVYWVTLKEDTYEIVIRPVTDYINVHISINGVEFANNTAVTFKYLPDLNTFNIIVMSPDNSDNRVYTLFVVRKQSTVNEPVTVKPGTAVGLTDIYTHWAYNYIAELFQEKIISGYSDSTFKPNNNVSRAEMAKMILTAKQYKPEDGTAFYFNDKNNTPQWAVGYINAAYDKKLIEGYQDKTFRASNNLTRAEAIKILENAFDNNSGKSDFKVYFADEYNVPAWAERYISSSYKKGFISGYDDNTIKPAVSITRGEFSKLLYMYLKG